jgi:hypothetical protein
VLAAVVGTGTGSAARDRVDRRAVVTGKQELFKTMTAEQKTMLWRTQIERWRDLNRARLTADQRALLDEFHAIIPLAVARPRTPEVDAQLDALEGRLAAAFTEDDLDAMDNYGPCLAKGR